jgi:hypothetical protein
VGKYWYNSGAYSLELIENVDLTDNFIPHIKY